MMPDLIQMQVRTLDVSMPGFIENLLPNFKYGNLCNVQSSPYRAPPKIYKKGAQDHIPADTTKKIDKNRLGTIL